MGGGEQWTKHKSWPFFLTGPPQRKLESVQNGIAYFDFETWHHINVQACPELVKAEEKKRRNEHFNTIYRLLPFSPAKKKSPKSGGMEVEEGEGRSTTGDRFSPKRRESHPWSCEK